MAFVKDETGHCVYANATFERYFNLTRDQWFGRTEAEIWPSQPATTEQFRRDDLRVLATDEPHQVLESITLPDGSTREHARGVEEEAPEPALAKHSAYQRRTSECTRTRVSPRVVRRARCGFECPKAYLPTPRRFARDPARRVRREILLQQQQVVRQP